MFLIVLAALIATGLAWQEPVRAATLSPSWRIAPVIGAYWLGAAVLGALSARLDMRVALQDAQRRWQQIAALGRTAQNTWLILGSAAVVACGYGRWVSDALGHLPLVPEALAAAPLAGALICMLSGAYGPYRTARLQQIARSGATAAGPVWTRWGHLSYHVRSGLLLAAVPLSLLVLIVRSLDLYAADYLPESVLVPLTLAGVAGVFLAAPAITVRVLKTRPLPEGPLRRDLQQLAAQIGFAFRDIRIWDTGGVVVNAAVMGLARPLRYVLITDAVLARMDTRRLQAIFAHEAGHAIFHHLPWYVVFAMATALMTAALGRAASLLGGGAEWIAPSVSLAAMAAAWLGGFGWISRRFERQSDVTAAWAGACDPSGRIPYAGAAIFVDALQELSVINGRPLTRRSWGHGSIASRIAYLNTLVASGGTRHEIDRLVRRIKALLLGALAVALAAIVGLELLGQTS